MWFWKWFQRRSFDWISLIFWMVVLTTVASGLWDQISPTPLPQTERSTAAVRSAAKRTLSFHYKNWGIHNSNVNSKGNVASHISAIDAWKIEKGKRNVVVAVIDTGIDPGHVDLLPNIWKGNKDGKSIFGWDFSKKKPGPNPKDENGHGTHVAGIIGAITNSKTGTSGVAKEVSIMALKYYRETLPGHINLANAVRAIHFAIDHGAKIINYSGGGPEFSNEEYLAIKRAEAQGVLIVSAAGNNQQNTDIKENYYYPSAYRLSNIISVAATDINNDLLGSSNWGKASVDIAAPGENIYSTIPGGRHAYMSGTSQATAFVSGLAALMLAKNPKLTPTELKEHILAGTDKLPQLKNKIASGGKVNAYRTMAAINRLSSTRALAKDDSKLDRDSILRILASPMKLLNTR